MGVRASLLRPRVGQAGERGPALHARLLPAAIRPLHRDHDAEPETRDPEEPEDPPAARALSGRQVQDLLPARLPVPSVQVRARGRLGLTLEGNRTGSDLPSLRPWRALL